MKAERRLAKLEASLPPREAVFHWLGDVHGHGSLYAYLEGPSSMSPLVLLTERARAAARTAHGGAPRPVTREAERRAAMDTVFLVVLVSESECDAVETIRIGGLRLEALRWESRARSAEDSRDRRAWSAWRTAVLELATELARGEAVRRILAERYLDGHDMLSPVVLAAWQELRAGVTALVETLPTLPGAGRRRRRDLAAIDAVAGRTAPGAAARLVERVRARTLDLLGDHAAALAVAERTRTG